MTRQVIEAAKGRLKVVGRAGVGVDNVDLTAATEVCLVFVKQGLAHGAAWRCSLGRTCRLSLVRLFNSRDITPATPNTFDGAAFHIVGLPV